MRQGGSSSQEGTDQDGGSPSGFRLWPSLSGRTLFQSYSDRDDDRHSGPPSIQVQGVATDPVSSTNIASILNAVRFGFILIFALQVFLLSFASLSVARHLMWTRPTTDCHSSHPDLWSEFAERYSSHRRRVRQLSLVHSRLRQPHLSRSLFQRFVVTYSLMLLPVLQSIHRSCKFKTKSSRSWYSVRWSTRRLELYHRHSRSDRGPFDFDMQWSWTWRCSDWSHSHSSQRSWWWSGFSGFLFVEWQWRVDGDTLDRRGTTLCSE